MPKVLLVANSSWGLANFRIPLARALGDAGVDVILVSPNDGYVSQLEEAGFRWIEWRLRRRGIMPISEATAVAHLSSIYRRERPDAVQHFTVKAITYGTLAAGFASVNSVVNTFTGVGFPFLDSTASRLARPVLVPILKRLLHRPGVVTVFHNAEDRQRLQEMGVCPKDRAHVILGSGVDTDLYRPRGERMHGGSVRILMVARLLVNKGVREFVDAADILAGRGVDARFELAGSPDLGSRRSVTADEVNRWGAESVVELLGFRTDTDQLIADSDIAVLPSYHEGMPRFLLEAMSCGLPVVTTDVVGCRALVKDGVNGFLVPPRDPVALADAIERLAGDPDLRAKLGQAGRRMAIEQFSNRQVLPQYTQLLTGGLAESSA